MSQSEAIGPGAFSDDPTAGILLFGHWVGELFEGSERDQGRVALGGVKGFGDNLDQSLMEQ